ncbi:MAG: CRTAC1 family protein [Lysobacterales bacterium]
MTAIIGSMMNTLLISTVLLAAQPLFDDRSDALAFTHFNGMVGEHYFPEMMGAGVALVDYDRDGDLDVYLVQGTMLGPEQSPEQALIKPASPLTDRLLRNDSDDNALAFTDVTAESKIVADGYGMGISVGDVNNDGWPDLYVSNFGPNQLWLNQRDGTFREVASEVGADDNRWTITAVFVDVDDDGWQDLYLVNYVDWKLKTAKTCLSHNDAPDYCSPQSYSPTSDQLLRNLGGGKYQLITGRAGMTRAAGPGLGAVSGDFNGDGLPDIYVANDGAANYLWMNQGGGRFSDEALMAGVAVNMSGLPEASMGVDANDFDGDGDLDLFMTHLDRQTNTLYVNDGDGWFMDQTMGSVLGASSFAFTGFGTAWFDLDNDGWLDLLSANGAVVKVAEQVRAGETLPLRQKNQLWRNVGSGRYEDISSQGGEAFARARVSRGAAFGDINNDGATDIVITNNAGPAELLINQARTTHGWLGLTLLNPQGGTAYGAQASLTLPTMTLVRRSRSDGSYLSAHDPRVLFGLGASSAKQFEVQVRWPGGKTSTHKHLTPGEYHTIRQPQ